MIQSKARFASSVEAPRSKPSLIHRLRRFPGQNGCLKKVSNERHISYHSNRNIRTYITFEHNPKVEKVWNERVRVCERWMPMEQSVCAQKLNVWTICRTFSCVCGKWSESHRWSSNLEWTKCSVLSGKVDNAFSLRMGLAGAWCITAWLRWSTYFSNILEVNPCL